MRNCLSLVGVDNYDYRTDCLGSPFVVLPLLMLYLVCSIGFYGISGDAVSIERDFFLWPPFD